MRFAGGMYRQLLHGDAHTRGEAVIWVHNRLEGLEGSIMLPIVSAKPLAHVGRRHSPLLLPQAFLSPRTVGKVDESAVAEGRLSLDKNLSRIHDPLQLVVDLLRSLLWRLVFAQPPRLRLHNYGPIGIVAASAEV